MSPLFWQYWAAAEIPGQRSQDILNAVGDSVSGLLSCPLLSEGERRRMEKAQTVALERALASGVMVLNEPDYHVVAPEFYPRVLFGWGDRACLDRTRVAIVGTRRCSAYGQAAAIKFGESLAASGTLVMSGGAAGIDACAHEGALRGGRTAAVLGCGVDVVYPQHHAGLFEKIRERGLLISQFACGNKVKEYTFNHRNVTLAALSDAVLVIEAPERSGSLQTAHAALHQNKPVFVVPGQITQFSFRGSHQLIRDGAILVDHPDQILEHLGLDPAVKPVDEISSVTHVQILESLHGGALRVDQIAEQTGLDATILLGELTELELIGLVMRDGAGYALRP